MQRALIVGGSNGIGMAIAMELKSCCDKIYIVDKVEPESALCPQLEFCKFDLRNDDFSFFDRFEDVDSLFITAGFGRVAPFEQLLDTEIRNSFAVNASGCIRVVRCFYEKLIGKRDFYCAIMGSIAGLISSPLFAVYGATKASLCRFVESVNIELEMAGSPNRILNVSPGSIQGTRFNGGKNDWTRISELARKIVECTKNRSMIYIPKYRETFGAVIERYNSDPHAFGIQSYEYKKTGNREVSKPQLKIGYLSGTFDLFHIGHLNLLRRAKEYCDYLVVGVHPDASHKGKQTYISFDERIEIVRNIKYVDRAIMAPREDSDVYETGILKFDFLFVGSDYQNTERFKAYEAYFADKGVRIVYFPYTQGTSSSQLREALIRK